MVNVEKAVPAPKKPEPGFWRLLVAFLTDPGCRQAFKEGWKEGWDEAKAKQDFKAKGKATIEGDEKLKIIEFRNEENRKSSLSERQDESFDHFKASFADPHNPFSSEEDFLVDPYFTFDNDSPIV